MAVDCGILICTCYKDREWLRYCRWSDRRFREGFSETLLALARGLQASESSDDARALAS